MKLKNWLKQNKIKMMSLVPMIVLIILWIVVAAKGLDEVILSKIMLIRNDYLTLIMKSMSNLCTPVAMLTISFLVLVIVKNKKIGFLQFVNFILAGVGSYILKYLFTRQRPIEFMMIEEHGYSFPSAHTWISLAFYGYIIYLILTQMSHKGIKYTLTPMIAIVLCLIVFSRLYLGVHFPTDVIAGLLFGYLYLLLFIFLTNQYVLKKEEVKQVTSE